MKLDELKQAMETIAHDVEPMTDRSTSRRSTVRCVLVAATGLSGRVSSPR